MQNTNRKCKIKNILFHTAVTTYTTQFYESYKPNNQTQPNEQYNDTKLVFGLLILLPVLCISSNTNFYTPSIPKNLYVV